MAATTAMRALHLAAVQSGQTVLINTVSGGIGTFAVQLAKTFGAEVTGVCSTRNAEMVRRILAPKGVYVLSTGAGGQVRFIVAEHVRGKIVLTVP